MIPVSAAAIPKAPMIPVPIDFLAGSDSPAITSATSLP